MKAPRGLRKVIEALPFIQIGFEIDVVLIGQELVELFLIRAMRALDLPFSCGDAGLMITLSLTCQWNRPGMHARS